MYIIFRLSPYHLKHFTKRLNETVHSAIYVVLLQIFN